MEINKIKHDEDGVNHLTRTRSISNLLTVLRDNARVSSSLFGLKKSIWTGLCFEAGYLCTMDIITEDELKKLIAYIDSHRPTYSKYPAYGWPPTKWRPRLRWLNKHIELTRKLNYKCL